MTESENGIEIDADTSSTTKCTGWTKYVGILKCRACLAENVPLIYLFDVYEHGLTLAAILQTCLREEVRKEANSVKTLNTKLKYLQSIM